MDYLAKLAAFVFVFGLLVVFHEFGHFIVARWMGVKVLSFSVGFGPVVWARTRNDTEYALRALPLGGFVRMLGDDPTAPLDAAIARDPEAFHNKPVWRRMLIVAAGPLFNFILPLVVLFVAALVYDGRVLSSRVGTPIAGGPAAEAGLEPGDLIVQVGDVEVQTFDDLVRAIGRRAGKPTALHVDRDGQRQTFTVTPREVVHAGAAEVGVVERSGRIQMAPSEQVATVAVDPGGALWQAGVRPGDRIRAVGAAPVKTWRDLRRALDRAAGPVEVVWTPLADPTPIKRKDAAQAMRALHGAAARRATVTPQAGADLRARWGARPGHRLVGPVIAGSAEHTQAGLRAGDEIVALDGAPIAGIEQLFDRLQAPYEGVLLQRDYRTWAPAERLNRLRAALQGRSLTVRRAPSDAEVEAARAWLALPAAEADRKATPMLRHLRAQADPVAALAARVIEFQAPLRVPVALDKDERRDLELDLAPLVDRVPPELIDNPRLIAHAVHSTAEQFVRGSTLILATTAELLKGNVPVKEVGGVIRMAQLTSEATDRGMERVLHLLAALSINLGILNLLPIPLVDGGHLLFLAIEGVRRRPASLRVRQVAAYVGLTFLGLLFLVVMKNDLQSLFAR